MDSPPQAKQDRTAKTPRRGAVRPARLAFRIAPPQPEEGWRGIDACLAGAVREIFEAQVRELGASLDEALGDTRQPLPDATLKAIHSARKVSKRLRAMLKLIHPHTRRRHTRELSVRVSNLARMLGHFRDQDVLGQTLDLAGKAAFPGDWESADSRMRDEVVSLALRPPHPSPAKPGAGKDQASAKLPDPADTIAAAQDLYRELAPQLLDLPWGRLTLRSLRQSLKKSWKVARDAWLRAEAHPDRLALYHKSRRHAKYLLHLVELAQDLHPQRLPQLAALLTQLAKSLGLLHDAEIAGHVTASHAHPHMRSLHDQLLRHQQKHLDDARGHAREIFPNPHPGKGLKSSLKNLVGSSLN